MNLHWFREFVVLAQTCSYLEAADRLFIGQSNLSKHIKAMELELGAPLFDRTSRRVRLTTFGEKLLPFAQDLVSTQLSMNEMAQNYFDATRGKVTIFSIPALAQYGITDIITHFHQAYPNYAIQVSENQPSLSEYNLRHGLCDLAFIRRSENEPVPEDLTEISFHPRDTMVAVVHKDHPLAVQPFLQLSQLLPELLITLEEGSFVHKQLVDAYRELGYSPQVAYTFHRTDSILDLVSKKIGIGIMMRGHTVRPSDSSDTADPPFKVVELSERITTNVNLYCRRSEPLSAAAQAFVDCVVAAVG